MIANIGHHYCVSGRAKTGMQVLLESGHGARLWPGFVRHLSMVSQSDPLKVTSVAVWQSKGDFETYANSPAHIRGGDYGLWDRLTEAEMFEVIPELVTTSPVAGGRVAAISTHHVVPDRAAEGRQLILEVGKGQRKLPGFVWHLSLVSVEDPLRLAAVTVWKSLEEYEAWRESAGHLQGADEGLWSRTPETELFEVVPELPWVFSKVPGEGVRFLD